MSKTITPKVWRTLCIREEDEPIAGRVAGLLDTRKYQIEQDSGEWWVERWDTSTPPLPRYAVEYLKKIIKEKYNLKYIG